MLGIIADDLTGAADTAVCFVGLGRVLIVCDPARQVPRPDEVGALCTNTGSRSASAKEAAERVRVAVAWLRAHGVGRFYKKIDSLLRGHLGVELVEAMTTAGCRHCLIVPAFPAQGRVTVGGDHYAGAGRIAHLPSLIHEQTGHRVAHIPLTIVRQSAGAVRDAVLASTPEATLITLDAEHDGDLLNIADAVDSLGNGLLACGTAGLARAMARRQGAAAAGPERALSPAQGPMLALIGSPHPTMQAQANYLQRVNGTVVFSAPPAGGSAQGARRVLEKTARALQQGTNVVLRTAVGARVTEYSPGACQALAALASRVMDRARVGFLLLSGGETAEVACRCLAAWGLEPERELLPGVPLSRLRGTRELPVVTKAGSFGHEHLLSHIVHLLHGRVDTKQNYA